jgi:subtilisin-like proprotein convertase family protein
VLFPTQTEAGTYSLALSSSIHDLSGQSLPAFQTTLVNAGPETFSNTTRQTIPSGGLAISPLSVARNLTIGNVQVTLNIAGGSDGQLYVHLQAPDGTDIPLVLDRGGRGQGFQGTTFSDAAATPISAGTAPFAGTYRPETALSWLNGRQAQGTWKLWLQDNGGPAPTLLNWSLILTAA